MTIIEKSIERVRSYRQAAGLSRYALAVRAGIGKNMLEDMDEPDWLPNARTLLALERVIPEDFGMGDEKAEG